jgi:hypothetical protein
VGAVARSGADRRRRTVAQPNRLTGSDALHLHLTLAAGLALCLGAFIIELMRALGGHSFSWLYVFEWPLFAGFAIYMWWNLLQGYDRAPRASTSASSSPPSVTPDTDLDAWNVYLQVMEAAEGDEPDRPT